VNHSENPILWVFKNKSWTNVQRILAYRNIKISGGSISKRQCISTVEFNFCSILSQLGFKASDIFESRLISRKIDGVNWREYSPLKPPVDIEIIVGVSAEQISERENALLKRKASVVKNYRVCQVQILQLENAIDSLNISSDHLKVKEKKREKAKKISNIKHELVKLTYLFSDAENESLKYWNEWESLEEFKYIVYEKNNTDDEWSSLYFTHISGEKMTEEVNRILAKISEIKHKVWVTKKLKENEKYVNKRDYSTLSGPRNN
jgi:hypothetical protein